MDEDVSRFRVSCRDCSFEKIVESGDDARPAEILVEHGRRTGHTLSVTRIEE